MSGGFPLLGSYANASTYSLAGVTVPGSANTKGAWTTIVSSLPFDAGAVLIDLPTFYNAATCETAMDIGVGTGGSISTVINNLLGTMSSPVMSCGPVLVPISIPAGTQVSARIQCSAVSGSPAFSGPSNITFFDTDFIAPHASIVDSLGFNATVTCGTVITPGAGSFGSFGPIATTAHDYLGFMAIIDGTDSFLTNSFITQINFAIGAAGSEKIIVPSYGCAIRPGSGFNIGLNSPWFLIPIPSGTPISAQGKTDSGAANCGITLYGLRA